VSTVLANYLYICNTQQDAHYEDTSSVVKNACLLGRYLAWIYENYIQNTSYIVKNSCLLARYLAMNLHVTIYFPS
jgi:hypothetical protein